MATSKSSRDTRVPKTIVARREQQRVCSWRVMHVAQGMSAEPFTFKQAFDYCRTIRVRSDQKPLFVVWTVCDATNITHSKVCNAN